MELKESNIINIEIFFNKIDLNFEMENLQSNRYLSFHPSLNHEITG